MAGIGRALARAHLRVGFALTLVLVLSGVAASPSAVCPVVETAPEVDGVLTDEAWEGAFAYGEFTDNLGQAQADPPMEFRVATDGPRLYMALRMDHPDPAPLKDTPVLADEPGIFAQDCVEVFLAPEADKPTYYHFAFGPTGSYWDNCGSLTQKDFNYNTQHAARIGTDGWTLEVALPLDELGVVGGVTAGHLMALNVCREFHTPGEATRLHCWSPTGPGFHKRDAFGQLLVGTYSASAQTRVGHLEELLEGVRGAAGDSEAVRQDISFWADRVAELAGRVAALKSADDWQAFSEAADEAEAQLQRLGFGDRGLVVYEVNPWDLPQSGDLPAPDVAETDEVALSALRGEHVTRAFAFANTTRDPLRVQCTSTDWHSPDRMKQLPASEYLALREAVEVGLRGGGSLRDALPTLDPGHHLTIPSGSNGIVWVTIDTHDMEPGVWVLALKAMPLLKPELRRHIRVVLRVLPVDMPQGPRPYSSNWFRLTRDPSQRYPEAAAADLKAHYTSIIHSRIGFPEYGDDGTMAKDIDFAPLEEDFERFGKDGNHFVIGRFYHWFPAELGNKAEWTDEQQERFAHVITEVRRFFEDNGLTTEDFSWYARDEPTTEETAESVVTFGKRLQLVDPEQRIFVTTYAKVTREALGMMVPYVNLWVPSLGLNDWQRELLTSRRDEGVRYFSYSVFSKAASPYWAHRLSAWKALKHDYEGIGFWCYDDVGGPRLVNWDDTDGKKSDYAVIYEGATGPVPSVRWEAWRQGIQDYRYVEWVRKLADECGDADLAGRARSTAERAISEVLSNKDKATADRIVSGLRHLAVGLLAAAHEIPADTAADVAIDLPFNLTGNGGPLSRHLDTHGSYRYNQYMALRHHGEACEVMEGPIYFKGTDATDPPQAESRIDGNLTDDLIYYPTDYALWSWPPAKLQVIFDLKATYRLSHMLVLFINQLPGQNVGIYMGDSDEVGVGEPVVTMPGTDPIVTPEGELYFDLAEATDRFVRLEIETTGQTVRLGEVRIWGWPVEAE